MRKIKLYIAISLDGKIAKADGNVDWLHEIPNPDQSDHGYVDFLKDIDTTLMGNKTYQQILGFDVEFPYKDKTNYVFTRNADMPESEFAQFISKDPIGFISDLKSKAGKDIWLIGGGQLNTLLFNHDLIDELLVFVMPVVIGDGIPLFGQWPVEKQLKLIKTEKYSTGAVLLNYALIGD